MRCVFFLFLRASCQLADITQPYIEDLFAAYSADLSRLPQEFAARAASLDENGRARLIADYIAGMTDRFALEEVRKLPLDGTQRLKK